MTTSVAEMITPSTRVDVERVLLSLLTLAGFPATSWQSGSTPRALVQTESDWLADLSLAIALIAKGGYLDDAEDEWLTLLAASFYQVFREPATLTKGVVRLTDVANAGPFNVQPGGLIVTEGSRTLRFLNPAGFTLPLGGYVDVEVQAESAGAAYNVATNGIQVLLTGLAGVSVRNPPIAGTSSWIEEQGSDEESDEALRARCKARWSTLGSGSTEGAYYYWATSVQGVRRATVVGDRVPVQVYVAGDSGPVDESVRVAVDTVLRAKKPLTVPLLTLNTLASRTAIAGTVVVDPKFDLDATLAAVKLALDRLARATPVGGQIIRDRIIQVVMDVPGVVDVPLTAPLANIALAPNQVFTPVYLLQASR